MPSSTEQSRNRYTAEDIHVLGGREAVRRRAGMYIGSTDQRGLQKLLTQLEHLLSRQSEKWKNCYCWLGMCPLKLQKLALKEEHQSVKARLFLNPSAIQRTTLCVMR